MTPRPSRNSRAGHFDVKPQPALGRCVDPERDRALLRAGDFRPPPGKLQGVGDCVGVCSLVLIHAMKNSSVIWLAVKVFVVGGTKRLAWASSLWGFEATKLPPAWVRKLWGSETTRDRQRQTERGRDGGMEGQREGERERGKDRGREGQKRERETETK